MTLSYNGTGTYDATPTWKLAFFKSKEAALDVKSCIAVWFRSCLRASIIFLNAFSSPSASLLAGASRKTSSYTEPYEITSFTAVKLFKLNVQIVSMSVVT